MGNRRRMPYYDDNDDTESDDSSMGSYPPLLASDNFLGHVPRRCRSPRPSELNADVDSLTRRFETLVTAALLESRDLTPKEVAGPTHPPLFLPTRANPLTCTAPVRTLLFPVKRRGLLPVYPLDLPCDDQPELLSKL